MVQQTENEPETNSSVLGVRHLQCFLMFLAITVSFIFRVNISIAIVAMTEQPSDANAGQTIFKWSEKSKSYILSSFFLGYLITQIPGGKLAHKYGGKYLLLIVLVLSAILTMLVPVAAKVGDWQLLCVVRLMLGLAQGPLFPSSYTILSKWSPIEERGILSTWCYIGSQFGTIIILSLSGLLASSSIGWPSIFYFSGALGLLWGIFWFIWGASSPSDYKNISQKERLLIEQSLGPSIAHEAEKTNTQQIPWANIFTSVPFLMVVLAQSTHTWGFNTLLTQIPAYMKNILGLDINRNAVLSSVPYIASLILGFVFSAISKALNSRISLTANRKLFNSISQWVPAVALIGFSYVSADYVPLAISLLTISVGVNAAYFLGWSVNLIDLTPNFSGILMSISNSVTNIVSFVAPLIVGIVVHDEKDPQQWRIVFVIASVLYFVGNLFFVLFGSAEIQPWNDLNKELDSHITNRDESKNIENS